MNRNVSAPATARNVAGVALAFALACSQAQDAPRPQQERLSTPRNAASQRYEINQTFGGQAYFKDNNIWVYSREFADLFGMPAKYVEGIQGITAAAFRLEEAPFQQCGFGGRGEACTRVDYCYLDLYFDESKTPLPWATPLRHEWTPRFSSIRWLRPLDEKEKPYGMAAPDTPPGIVRNEALVSPLVAFADPASRRQAIFTSNVGDSTAGAEEVAGGSLAVLGYSRGFYRTLSLVSLQFSCLPFSRTSINVRLDAKREVYDTPIARFNRVFLSEGFVQRVKEVLEARRQRTTEFHRSLISPASGARGAAPQHQEQTGNEGGSK